jgi:mRNA interferase MazF
LVCLLTTTLRDAPMYRLTIQPTAANGLRVVSQIMVDKVCALRRDKCGLAFGHLEQDAMVVLNRMLALVMGMADWPPRCRRRTSARLGHALVRAEVE